MASPRLRLDPRALRSRVARRIFLVFAACSLLPVGAFALFAFWHVRGQLEADAMQSLRHASKAAGMSILERLMIADAELDAKAESGTRGASAGKGTSSAGSRRIRRLESWPQERARGLLDADALARLRDGQSVLAIDPSEVLPARIRLLRLHDVGAPEGAVWAAELDPEFVFEPRRRSFGDRYWVEDASGRVLFESPEGAATMGRRAGSSDGRGWRSSGAGSDDEPVFFRAGTEGEEIGARWVLFLQTRFRAPSWTVAFSRPVAEVQRPLLEFEATFPLVAIAAIGVALALSLSQIRRFFVPIDQLIDATKRLSTGDLDARVSIRTGDELERLGVIFNEMASEIGRQIRVLSSMNAVGRSLSAELDTQPLLDLILRETLRVTESVGAALFLALEGRPLELARLHRVGSDGESQGVDASLHPAVARRCFSRGTTLSTAGIAELPPAEQEAWRALEDRLGVRVGPQVAVPMRDGRGEAMGALILFRESGAPGFTSESCEIVESVASQAATAITKNHLVDSFRALFEGVIQLTVRAIDEKSRYTGDHCRNVPILTEMIADAACGTTHGPLKNFDLDEDERYELRIAALLHDCGKVATPVHVMDKATKLETIFDRIELVDTRFEIVRRDLQASAADRTDEEIRSALARLESDRAFLRACNRGVEAMSDEAIERVHAIAGAYEYTTVLGVRRPLLDADEVRNLTIRRGTLNPDERKVIEQHVVTTIDLLSELPFPPALRAVPEIAGSHHERVDGGGYPNRLTRDQITLQGRILGLADVFEALTAKDRPYKPGRTLSETFEILDQMRAEGAIDPDLYDLFKAEKVYLPYIAENVAPEQIDGPYWEELERFTADG